jgi:hypothetical protein
MMKLSDFRHVGVGNPGVGKIKLDSLSGCVLHCPALIERRKQQKR